MKLRTAVLTSAFVMFATASQAQDINSPFYLPSKGKMLSETSMEYNRVNNKFLGNMFEGWYAKQELAYGVSDNMSVFAAIGNTFDNNYGAMDLDYNNSHNFDYTVGIKYNKQFNNVLTQFQANYNTYDIETFFSDAEANNWEKNFTLGTKVGYQMDNGFLPYVSFDAKYILNTGTTDDVYPAAINLYNSSYESQWLYYTYAGVYKDFGKFSTDVGVKWINARGILPNIYNDELKSRDDVYAQAEVNYNLSDTMSVGVYGEYLIGDSQMGEIDYIYTLGANLKVAF